MSAPLVREEDGKGFLLTRFWAGGAHYEIHDSRGEWIRLTEEQARFLVEVLKCDLKVQKP
jgi:hypothetical protein